MICISPRASAGFKMLAASMAPPSPPPPAPTSVWISSIIKIIFGSARVSSMMFFKRSSNSPRYLAPDSMEPMSISMMRLFCSISGTSPLTMRCASPSATAVFPTPGSPINTGLFFDRRARIWIARSISSSRPTMGSMRPSAAACVKSLPNSSKAFAADLDLLDVEPEEVTATSSPSSCRACSSSSAISFIISADSTCASCNTSLMAASSLSFTRARRMCTASVDLAFSSFDSSTAKRSMRLQAGEKGMSSGAPGPRPMRSSTILVMLLVSTPILVMTFSVTPPPWLRTPTNSISLLTKFCPNRLDCCCAAITDFSAFSLKRSKSMVAFVSEAAPGTGAAEVTDPAMEEPMKPELLEEKLPCELDMPSAPVTTGTATDLRRPLFGKASARRSPKAEIAAAAAPTPAPCWDSVAAGSAGLDPRALFGTEPTLGP
mmetsp:Transcript_91133/g.162228  ORF Transcript_91133/g.162228 Transcript_91133/m.162228 type:complete len:432 (-) Transcript_91133:201-1496(-)